LQEREHPQGSDLRDETRQNATLERISFARNRIGIPEGSRM
jgi:hypothetical protein